MQTGEKIAALRAAAGLTQEQLAGRLFVSQQLVSAWEKGLRRPDRETSRRLALILSCDEAALLPDDGLLDELSGCIPEGFDAQGKELTELLNGFLASLGDKERTVFVMRYYRTAAPKEIAAEINKRDNYVRAVLSRTRKKLFDYLSEVKK